MGEKLRPELNNFAVSIVFSTVAAALRIAGSSKLVLARPAEDILSRLWCFHHYLRHGVHRFQAFAWGLPASHCPTVPTFSTAF